MSPVWLSEAKKLADEVEQWAQSERFFQRLVSFDAIRVGMPLAITDEACWFSDIDIKNEESRFVELNAMIEKIGGAYIMIHQYSSQDLEEHFDRATESISRYVGSSPEVKVFARWLLAHSTLNMDWNECYDQLCTTVSGHLSGVIRARVLTASKRYLPTETIFELYQHGLFPFGWDWDSFLCLDPSALQRAVP